MSLLDDLQAGVDMEAPVRSVLVGSHWVAVCSRYCGLASALRGNHSHGTPEVRDAGQLHSKPVRDLVGLVHSDSLLERSIGIAALNSILDVNDSRAIEMNASDVLADRGKDKTVALVGHFPFIPQLQRVAKQLWVLEQQPAPNEYPAEAASELLPRADLVAITGTAIINGTMEALLRHCKARSTIMVLGPSTPLSPVLFDYGVDILSGSRVMDEEAVLQSIGQGASFRQVAGVRLLTFIHGR
jgi:uncharacterized protein (DUF4213/DUF364 family)